MEKVQDDIRRATGLRLSLMNLDWKSYIHSLQSGPTPLFRFAWLAPFLDPVPHLQVFTSGNPNNYTGWSSAKYDGLVRDVEGMPPGPARLKKILAAQEILLEDDVVIVPIYHYVQNHAVSKRVKEFHVSPFGAIPFDEIRLSQKGSSE
jgi:oligopeptide transport system substrate-binding protein